MGKIIYSFSVSLDGFVESARGDLDWSLIDEEIHTHFNEQERSIDLFLYGRRLYELMASFWPTADTNPKAPAFVVEYAKIWKSKPKVVFSTTLTHVEWNSRLVRDNLAAEVQRLKAEPGKHISVGGPALASSLIQLDLVDEYWLYLNPLLLGGGKPMFPALKEQVSLSLLETKHFASGVMLLRYERKQPRH